MELKKLLTDDEAVSPVIGVILMVAITVILAAVIAAFVLGLGDTTSTTPQVSFDYDYDSGSGDLTIKVESGDEFEAGQVAIKGDLSFDEGSTGDTFADIGAKGGTSGSQYQSGSTVSAGDRIELGGLSDTFELELVFEGDDGSDSSILSERTGPDA